ncbi:MAG: sulfate adenylyltransferase subunit CysN [Pseudomonadota bacterium]
MAALDAPLLRMVMCGSVDDGKSTLIGRLLYESKQVFDDQLAALAADSKKYGTQGDDLDFALLLDGLVAEREQGITIDVAYRFFSTGRRQVIVADTPGHEQYTRNMVTGASTADAAVILVDARKGIVTQTRRHAYLVGLMGVRHAVLAVNKMDLVDYSEQRFHEIEGECAGLAQRLGLMDLAAIPLSALTGDNVVAPGGRMPWYRGRTLMGFIDAASVDEDRLQALPFRLPVQWVNRPNQDFRGFAGTVASGVVRAGERVRIHPSGRQSTVARIVTRDGDLPQAVAGQSITLTLADEIDISRGDVIVRADSPASVADQFEATLIWMDEEPMLGGRLYLMKIGAMTAVATPSAPKYRLDVNTLEHLAARKLELNDIGVCNIALDRPIAFDPYAENREMGGFILIDRLTNRTFGAGLLHFSLRRAHNIQVQALNVERGARAGLKGQRACVLWLTGLSGAGKSTIANLVDSRLYAMGRHTYLLDGDNVRHGLCRDLGFTDADRVENVRRVAEVAKLMSDAGLIVIASLISPYRSDRRMARDLMKPSDFVEIFVDAPLAVAEQRDPKGLYRKARRGELKNFTGIDAPYEAPENAELHLETAALSPEDGAEQVIQYLARQGIIPPAA